MNRQRLASAGRVAVGPLALAGFFLPWAHGPGVFAANEFTGFALLGFAGRLQALDFSLLGGSLLWLARLSILGVVIASAWQTLLAPRHHWHRGYGLSGWYLAVFTLVALALGAAKSGPAVPPSGLALLLAASLLFIASSRATRRQTAPAPA